MWLVSVVALSGCKKVEAAPEELDDLFHWFWQEYDEGTDEVLAGGLVNLHAAVGGNGLEEAFDGTVTDLAQSDAALVGVDADPALASGVFLVNTFPCGWSQLEEILSFGEQEQLYEGVYHAYERTYDSPRDAWLSGEDLRLAYLLEYEADVLGSNYTARIDGVIRRVADLGAETSPHGAFLAQRSVMPEPGEFEEGSGKTMDQDYQIEIYWSPAKGQVLHAYALWRQADWGSGFDSDNETAQRIMLNNLLSWDRDTAKLCEEGRP
jgi:hypothetical protein